MKVNNFEQIKTLLTFESDDEFYVIHILKRKKDNPELESNVKMIKTYFVNSLEYLNRKQQDIIEYCIKHNARAYINLNVRSYKRVALQTLVKTAQFIEQGDYKAVQVAFEKSVTQSGTTRNKSWVLDVDDKEVNTWMLDFIDRCEPVDVGSKVITIIPTVSGYHVITKPFNVKQFKERYMKIEVKKNNPTILYA